MGSRGHRAGAASRALQNHKLHRWAGDAVALANWTHARSISECQAAGCGPCPLHSMKWASMYTRGTCDIHVLPSPHSGPQVATVRTAGSSLPTLLALRSSSPCRAAIATATAPPSDQPSTSGGCSSPSACQGGRQGGLWISHNVRHLSCLLQLASLVEISNQCHMHCRHMCVAVPTSCPLSKADAARPNELRHFIRHGWHGEGLERRQVLCSRGAAAACSTVVLWSKIRRIRAS